MLETHPYGDFIPLNAKYLILGSFPARDKSGYDWFYSSKRNQFWKILEGVYSTELSDVPKRKALCTRLNLAMSDIIFSCKRKLNNNLDMNLTKISLNSHGLSHIFSAKNIQKVYFTSKFVEKLFLNNFLYLLDIKLQAELITLPSPSPRYAKLSLQQKVDIYSKLLPKIE